MNRGLVIARVLVAAVVAALLTACAETKPDVPLPQIAPGYDVSVVTQIGGLQEVAYVTVAGGMLYVADESGLHLYDVSDPAQPSFAGSLTDFPVHRVRVVGDRAYTIDVDGTNRLRAIDVSDPSMPRVVTELSSPTARFGGMDARPGLVWHAVGQIPPSRLYFGAELDADRRCDADDRERGAMDVWFFGDLAVLSIHFDDFAGDGLDGNGAFGFVLWDLDLSGGGCPTMKATDIIFSVEHDANRSKFDGATSSDLQASYDLASDTLFLSGEQRLAVHRVDGEKRATEIGTLALPEVLDVEHDGSCTACGSLVGMANGDFLLIDASDPAVPALVGVATTPGIARTVAPAGDGQHFFVADSEAGVAVVEYLRQ